MAKTRRVKGNRKKKPARKPARKPAASAAREHTRSREAAGVLALGAMIFLVISLLSLQVDDGSVMGPFGRSFAVLGYSLFGMCAYLAAIGGALLAVRTLMEKEYLARIHHVLGVALGIVCLAILFHLIGKDYRVAGYGPGGLIGENIGETMRSMVSTAGTALCAIIGLMLAVVISTPLRMRTLLGFLGGASARVGMGAMTGARRVGTDAAKFSGEVIRAVLPEREHDEYLDDYYDEEDYDEEEALEEEAAVIDPPIIDARSGAVESAMGGDTEKVDASHMAALAAEEEAKPKKKKGRKKKFRPPKLRPPRRQSRPQSQPKARRAKQHPPPPRWHPVPLGP